MTENCGFDGIFSLHLFPVRKAIWRGAFKKFLPPKSSQREERFFTRFEYFFTCSHWERSKVVESGVIVKIKVNGKSYKIKTNKDGYALFKINLKPGKYIITAEYNSYIVSNKINVKSLLTAKNIFHKKAKKIKFSSKLVDIKGKALKGKKITFKFKGKIYKVKTNKNGIATLTIKNLKVGKYTIMSIWNKFRIKNTSQIQEMWVK